jgi:hypothetical protein
MKILKEILDWSEVWALFIPLAFMLMNKNKISYLKPVRIYLWIALSINIFIDIISNLKDKLGIQPDDFLWNNNFLYNIGSVVRLVFFAWFFILLQQRFMHRVKRILPFIFFGFLLINFIFFEDFIPQGDNESFSSRLLALEAAILLFYCLQYFIYIIVEDKTIKLGQQPGFWLVIGLSLYVAVNFFIFLFYATLSDNSSMEKREFAIQLWDVHNIAFILLCFFMAIQFSRKNV